MKNELHTQPDRISVFAQTINAVHGFLKRSVKGKKQVIADSISNFKDGLAEVFADKRSYADLMTLPVNNFLKDFSQIEKEFEAVLKKDTEYSVCLDGKMVPASKVLSMPMEENY